MIAYCPLDEVEPPRVVENRIQPEKVVVGREETELNYVIMAFIVGVIVLALSDSIRV